MSLMNGCAPVTDMMRLHGPSRQPLWSDPASRKKMACLYLWKSYESAAHLHLNMGSQQMKPTITVSADHKVSVLVVVLIRHRLKSPGCISVTRNKNIPIENKTRSLSFSRRKRLSKDVNLPEDVNVCGVTGSAPPLSHQHTACLHY